MTDSAPGAGETSRNANRRKAANRSAASHHPILLETIAVRGRVLSQESACPSVWLG